MLFRNVQKFAKIIKNICDWVLLKKFQIAIELSKDFIKGLFLWNSWNFSEQLHSRTTFSECFCLAALSKQQVSGSSNKWTPSQVVWATLWNNFSYNAETFLKKCLLWSTVTKTSQVFQHFPWTFSNFLEQLFWRPHTNNLFWSLDVFLVYYREALLSSLS